MSGAPHRSAELVALCASCGVVAEFACVRCGRPQCLDHRTLGDRRCAACEADWEHRELGITRITPKKIGGLRTYGSTVIAPSAVVGGLAGLFVAIAGALKGAVGAGLLFAAQLWLALFVFCTILLTIPFLMIGTPLFARRKVKELAQWIRHSGARRRFLEERTHAADQEDSSEARSSSSSSRSNI